MNDCCICPRKISDKICSAIYCSRACKNIGYRRSKGLKRHDGCEPTLVTCGHCAVQFLGNQKHRYCSAKCKRAEQNIRAAIRYAS